MPRDDRRHNKAEEAGEDPDGCVLGAAGQVAGEGYSLGHWLRQHVDGSNRIQQGISKQETLIISQTDIEV